MKRKARDAAERYHELRRSIAARTGLADDSPRLDYLAMLSLQVDRVKLRLINGDSDVSSGELLTLQAAVVELSPEPTHNVNIQFCKRLFGVCRHCGELSELDEELPPLDPPPSPKPPIPAADLKAQPKPELKLFTNVVPIKPDYAPPA
jgi:hypothetical protein